MTTTIQTVNRITDKHAKTIYNGQRVIINEKNTPFQIRIGPEGSKYYFHGMVAGKSKTEMIGKCQEINLYRAYEIVDEIKGTNLKSQRSSEKTLLEAIYGDPALHFIENTSELIERLPLGCFLFAKKDRDRFNNIRSDMNALLSFYTDKNKNCSIHLSKLNSTNLVEQAEKLHHEQGRTSGGATKTFAQWKSFFKWLKQRKILNENLLDDSILDLTVSSNERVDRTFSNQEISIILKSFPNEIKPPFGYLAPLGLLLCRRNATLSKIKKSYIDWDNSLINSNREIEKKGRVAKNLSQTHLEVMMGDYAKELIKSLCDEFPDSEWLFPNPDDQEKHIEVGVNGNTTQLLYKPREIFKKAGEIIPFSNDRLRSTYNTSLNNITDNQRIIEFICGLTSNMSIQDIHYNKKDYRSEKLLYLNQLAELYKGNIGRDSAEIVHLPEKKRIYDSLLSLNDNRKRTLLKDKDNQLEAINDLRQSNGLSTNSHLTKDYRIEGFKFFNKVSDFEIYKERKMLFEAKKMLSDELREYILAVDLFNKNINLKPLVNLSGQEYLDTFDKMYDEQKNKTTTRFNKQDPKKLKKISDVLFLQDLKDNFDGYKNIVVIDLNGEANPTDPLGILYSPDKAEEYKKTIKSEYEAINNDFKYSVTEHFEETRRNYRKYLLQNRENMKLQPLWFNLEFVHYHFDYGEDSEKPIITASSNSEIPEHYYLRKINNIIYSAIN